VLYIKKKLKLKEIITYIILNANTIVNLTCLEWEITWKNLQIQAV